LKNVLPDHPIKKPIEIELHGDNKSNYYMGIDVGRAEGGSNFSISVVKRKTKEKQNLYILLQLMEQPIKKW
jgi:hypothetical protein